MLCLMYRGEHDHNVMAFIFLMIYFEAGLTDAIQILHSDIKSANGLKLEHGYK